MIYVMCVRVRVCVHVALSLADVEKLLQTAADYRPGMLECKYLYRNKSEAYFKEIEQDNGGIMKTYLKMANGDMRSPTNGQIFGLFFCANVNWKTGQPMSYSPYGIRRVLITVDKILELTPNMFFSDFYCMRYSHDPPDCKDPWHNVDIILTKDGSSADQFCKSHLPRLDSNSNPFLCKKDEKFWVAKYIFVHIFVTENLNLKEMQDRGVCTMDPEEFAPRTRGGGTQDGVGSEKKAKCETCDIFGDRFLAERQSDDIPY